MHITVSTKLPASDLAITLVLFLGFCRLIKLPVAIFSRHLLAPSLQHMLASGWPGLSSHSPLLGPSPRSFRNHHTMAFSSLRGSKAWSGGTLVTGNYQLEQTKWLLERPLKTHRATHSLRHSLACCSLSIWFTSPPPHSCQKTVEMHFRGAAVWHHGLFRPAR